MRLKKDMEGAASYGNVPEQVYTRISDAIISLNPNWQITYLNEKAAKLLRKKNQNLLGCSILSDFPEFISSQTSEEYKNAMSCQESKIVEVFHDSLKKWYEHRVYPATDGITIYFADITVRKNKEILLADKDEQFQNMFMNHCSIMLVIDPQTGSIVGANLSAEKFYGYTIAKLRTMNINEINTLASKVKDGIKQVLDNTKHQFVFTHRLASGEFRVVEVSTSAFSSGGRPLIFSIVTDVTERKQTEDALRRTQFTVDQVRDEVFWINSTGEMIYVNNSVCAALGYSKEELSKMTILDIDPHLDHVTWPEHWKETSNKKSYIFETTHRTKDGKIIPVEISLSAMDIDGEIIHCSYARDITQRKAIEQALENERTLLKTLIENLPNPVFVKDKNFRTILLNSVQAASVAGHLKSLGLNPPVEILNKTDYEVFPKKLADKYFDEDRKIICDGQTKLFEEERGFNRDGEPIWLLMSKIPLKDKTGNTIGMVGITTDITAQKRIEETLNQTKEELININRAQQMLSKCNKVLVRANEENKLLNEICGIIVETGIYNFAWVGYAEINENTYVRPVAQAGDDKNYLEYFRTNYTGIQLDCEPLNELLESGTPVIFDNSKNHALTNKCYRDALQHGYNSVISLPLSYKGKTFGILNVYSKHLSAFSEPETTFLTELADDLAFGIETLRDQIKHVQAQSALQVSEERLRQAIRVSSIGIFDHDHLTNTIHWSEHQRAIYGWQPDEVVTLPAYFNCIYPEDRDEIMMAVQHAHNPSSDGRFDVEHRIIRRDGAIRWLTMRSQTYFRDDGDGIRPVRTVGASMDITESKLAEVQLRKLYIAIEQSPASVVITNTKGEIEYVNTKFTKMSGYSPEEIQGKQLRILKQNKNHTDDNQKIWDTILSGSDWKGEYYNKHKDGNYFWESTLLSPIINNNGKITNFLAIQEDVTEKKKTLEELILAKERAEEANRVKDVFLANMSHELRTPLIVVLGYSQLLLEVSTEPDTIEMATGIRKGGIRLLNTLNSILDLTRIESVRFELDLKILNLLDEVKSVYESFREAVAEKNLNFSLQINNDQLFTKTDQRIFSNILKNLLNNAVKFTNEGGIIIICGIDASNMIYVTVKDTGIGIIKEHHEMIFEEFHQVSEGINREYQGLGLGLAITKKYVEILGGKISVESQLGVGSAFTIRFTPAT